MSRKNLESIGSVPKAEEIKRVPRKASTAKSVQDNVAKPKAPRAPRAPRALTGKRAAVLQMPIGDKLVFGISKDGKYAESGTYDAFVSPFGDSMVGLTFFVTAKGARIEAAKITSGKNNGKHHTFMKVKEGKKYFLGNTLEENIRLIKDFADKRFVNRKLTAPVNNPNTVLETEEAPAEEAPATEPVATETPAEQTNTEVAVEGAQ